MNKKIIIFLLLVCTPFLTRAQVVLNEIMYDLSGTDTKREWVEIYNTGASPVTVVIGGTNSAWRFSDGSQHELGVVSGSVIIPPGEYGIITNDNTGAGFLLDWPSFSGSLFNSSFSLNNTEDSLSLMSSKDGEVLSLASYNSNQGAKGDGNSLQRQAGGTWIAALPTPGLVNATTAYVPPDDSGDNSGTTTATSTQEVVVPPSGDGGVSVHSSQANLTSVEIKSPSVGVGRKRYVTVGTPITFDAWTKDTGSLSGNYFWSFGDGSSAVGIKTSHTYLFSGIYNVVLNANFNGQEAVSRTFVKVFNPEIKIKQIDTTAGFVELVNNSTVETNLFGWYLGCDNNSFSFPRDTIVSSKDSLKIPLSLTKCSATTTDWSLLTQNGIVLAQYQSPKISENIEVTDREKTISLIRQSIILITSELEKRKNQSTFANRVENYVSQVVSAEVFNGQNTPATSSEIGINPSSQVAGVIVLDKDPLPTNKSFFSRLKSWFGR